MSIATKEAERVTESDRARALEILKKNGLPIRFTHRETAIRNRMLQEDIAIAIAEARAQDWQPIETAPKDGSRILVKDRPHGLGMCVASAGWRNDAPHLIEWQVVNDVVAHPTHWMPLPKPPVSA